MKSPHPFLSRRGSALLSVVVFTTVALLLVASLLNWGMTERRLNYRNALRLEARNAAEALAEYGFAQIREKMASRSSVTLDPDGTDALVYPATAFWSGSNVNTAKNELIGGTVQIIPADGSSYYFNPADPNNAFDPLNGKHVFRRDVQVIAKSTVKSPGTNGGEITAYVSQRISVRGAPLFAHAIFYNMDLEIFNGPAMTISGPVHTNGNLYLYPDNSLTFTDQVTTTGNIYHAKKPGDTSTDGNSASGRAGSINFPDKFAQPQNLKVSNVWKDSTQGAGTSAALWEDFRNFASQRWNGNLQTSSHGVSTYNPVAIGEYTEDATPTSGTDETVNSGRSIIEPSNYPAATDPDYSTKMEIEQQKYANDAGIYISVNPTTKSITLSSRSKTPDPSTGLFKNKTLTLPSGNTLVTYKSFKATSTYSTTSSTKTYAVTATGSGSNAGKFKYTPTTASTTTPATITYTSSGAATTTGTTSVNTPVVGSQTGYRSTPPSDNNQTITASTTPTSPTLAADNQGMYDQHRQKGTDLVEIDMDALRKAVAYMAGASTATTTTGSVALTASDEITGLTTSDWTGIVYVEVQGGPKTDPITGATISATNPASLQTSVRIINGSGKVPSHGTATEGLTFATNAPVYIKGSYNADGTTSTSSPNSATTPETGEVPAAIVGDAVTILSKNFSDSSSLSTLSPDATTTTIEVAAALLVGLTPTNKQGDGKTSGGAHNLPRFLETWGNSRTVFIRGSLVALFENRVFTEPHGTSNYYSPPLRNWGFNTLFRDGRYPPGTPRVMSYRRVDFTDLTAAQYEAAKASFNW